MPGHLQAGKLLAEGKRQHDSGNRMGALQSWEDCLNSDPDAYQRRAALFNSTCVHAGFGDVELAQITLREAVQDGLDFKKATENPESIGPDMVRLVASQQVLIRLRKFNEAVLKVAGQPAPAPGFSGTTTAAAATGESSWKSKPGRKSLASSILQDDLSKMLETDMQGIDTSVFGIIRRVVLLLVALAGLGATLFYIGMKYLFPES